MSQGKQVPITATFKTSSNGFKHAGSLVAKSQCWSFLKGGLSVDDSGPAELYFEVLYLFEPLKKAPIIYIYA